MSIASTRNTNLWLCEMQHCWYCYYTPDSNDTLINDLARKEISAKVLITLLRSLTQTYNICDDAAVYLNSSPQYFS